MLLNLLIKSFANLSKCLYGKLFCFSCLLKLYVFNEKLRREVVSVSKDIKSLEHGTNKNPDYKICNFVFTVCFIIYQYVNFS